jgi:hypothetical protein
MGIGTVLIKNNGGLLAEPDENVLSQSIKQWLNINSRVLLLVFLPGLIYKDAYGMVRTRTAALSHAREECFVFSLTTFVLFLLTFSRDRTCTFLALR